MQGETHTPACREFQEYLKTKEAAYHAWMAHWTQHCPSCGGQGRFDDSDPSVGMYGWVDCEDCTAKGFCPRCGRASLVPDGDSYTGPCGYCGFNYGENAGDVPPILDEGTDCICPRQPYTPPELTEEELRQLPDWDYDPDWQSRQNQRIIARRC